MFKKNRLQVLLAAALLTGGILAGCSSSTAGPNPRSKSTGTGSTKTTANSTGTASTKTSKGNTSGTMNIAVVAAFSGTESFIGPRLLNGVKVAVNQINANGGIMGKKLNIVTGDTKGDPVDAVPAVNKVISTQHPVAMIGPASLSITSVITHLNSDQLVDITLGGTTQLDKMNYPYIFRTSPSDSQMGVAMAYYGLQKGYKKAALVLTSSSAAQTLDTPVKKTFKKHGGQVIVDAKLVPDQTSYRSEILKIINKKPDVIFMQLDPQTASTFFSELNQLGGGNIPVVGSDVTSSADFAKAIGKGAAKHLTSIQGSTTGTPAAKEYVKFYGNVFQGKKPVTLSSSAYDGVNVIALAMEEAKSTDPAKYVKYMMKVANGPGTKIYDFKSGVAAIKQGKSINYTGASGPIDFNQYHNVTGAFNAVQRDASGNLQIVKTIPAKKLMNY